MFKHVSLQVKRQNVNTIILHPIRNFLLSCNKIYRMNFETLHFNFIQLYLRNYAEFRKCLEEEQLPLANIYSPTKFDSWAGVHHIVGICGGRIAV